MPKQIKEAGDRRVMVSIKQAYLGEAGKAGVYDIEQYIEWLKERISYLQQKVKDAKGETEATEGMSLGLLHNQRLKYEENKD